jgi:hypothetical protein
VQIALATYHGSTGQFDDDRLLAAALATRGAESRSVRWDDPDVRWDVFDLVVIRSTWDYTDRLGEFLAWADSLDGRLRNAPELVRWNSDKRYLGDLAAAGVPVVPTEYVEPGAPVPALAGEVAVKPTVSAGGRDTGRFSEATHADARALIERITAEGRTAMVQPYLASVDSEGETALVFIAGRLAHVLRKRAVLAPDEVAPVRDDELGAAEAMYDPGLVRPASARPAEIELGSAVVEQLRSRFGAIPLIARTDLVGGPDGAPCVLELEAVEPHLYLEQAPDSVELLAEAIVAEASSRR